MRVLAIVPAFNEQESVAAVVREIRACDPRVTVAVIDDGSTDGTAAAAAAAGARVVRLPFNLGIGGAVQTGYRLALDEHFDVAVQVDGDGQHPADQIPAIVDALGREGVSYVIGSRFTGDRSYTASRSRRSGMLVLSFVISRLVRRRMTDTTSGFRASDRRAIALFARHYPHDYPEVEAIVIASRAGLQVAEVAVEMRARATGRSSITPLRSIYYMVKVLLAVLIQCIGPRPSTEVPA